MLTSSPPPAADRRYATLKGVAFSLLAYLLFATSDMLVKLLLGRYSTFQVLVSQATFGMIPVMFLLRQQGLHWPKGKSGAWLWLRAILGAVGGIFGFFAFARLPMADVYALAFCAPLIVTVLAAPLLGEKVGIRRYGAAIVGFIGVLVMVRPGFQTLELGHLAAFLTAFSGATTLMIVRSLRQITNAATMAFAVMVGLFVVNLPVLPFVWVTPNWQDLGIMVASGLVMGSAQFAMLRALSSASAAAIAPMQYTMMVWAVVYGYFVFGNAVSPFVILGSTIVVASSVYTMYRERVRGITQRSETPSTPGGLASAAPSDGDASAATAPQANKAA